MRVLFPVALLAVAFASPVSCLAAPAAIARSLAFIAMGNAVPGKLIIRIDTRAG